jgi:hypothetical protein
MCDETKLREGVSVELPEMKEIYKIRSQCYTYKGKFVKLITPQGFDFNQFAPSRTYGPGEELPPGVYTYLFPSIDRIICVPVKNKFELGTIHYVLAWLSRVPKVIAAGELRVERDTITFNLLSGSFMRNWMESDLGGKCNTQLRDLTQEMLRQQYPSKRIEYNGDELITEENVPVTAEELNRYLEMGIEVRLYESKSDCRANVVSLESALQVQERSGSAQANATRAEIERLNESFKLYKKSSGGKRRKTRRRLQKRRKTRRL